MKNEQIILNNRIELMRAGIINATGRTMMVETDEGRCEIAEPEQIHTKSGWHKLGRKVRDGEKPIACFPIWKFAKSKADDEDVERERMFKADASWYTFGQTD